MKILSDTLQELTNFTVHLVRMYRAPDDSPSSLMLELNIVQGTHQQSLVVPYDKLDQLDIQQLVPGCVYLLPKAKKAVLKQIRLSVSQQLQSENKVGRLYLQSGWAGKPSDRIFVAGKNIISKEGVIVPTNTMISKEVSQLHLVIDNTLTPSQSTEQLLRALLRDGDYAIPVFSYTLYSLLHSVWSEVNLPTACVLNLIGTQGYGKTTLVRNFCALYNDENERIADFYDAQSTLASMRKALAEARDRVVIVDDLCKSTSSREMQKRRDLTASLLRNAANESPVSKMSGDTTTSFACMSGLVLTGELPLEVPSDVTRCVIIEVKRPLRSGNPDERTIAATAAAAYIQWLCAHFSEEMNRIELDYHAFSEKDSSKNLWRLKKSLFQLDWTFGSFLRFAKSVDAITNDVQEGLGRKASDVFQKIFSYEEGLVHAIENAQPSQWKRLITEGARREAFPHKRKSTCICAKPADLTRFLRVALQNPTLQEHEVITKLKTQNILLMDKSGKSTKKVSGTRMLNINIFD